MEASLATDSEWVIIRGPNFVSTFLFNNFREMDIKFREEAFEHLYLMCQFEERIYLSVYSRRVEKQARC